MPMDALLLAVMSAATLISLVRGAQGIIYFRWNLRQRLWYGYWILVGVFSAYITSHLIYAYPMSMIAVVSGLAGGGLLLGIARPWRPTSLSRRSGAISVLILACILGIVWVIAPGSLQLLEGGIALLAFSFVVLLVTRVNPEGSGVQRP
jgi:hypothetical protein